jgi:hypothetical protein
MKGWFVFDLVANAASAFSYLSGNSLYQTRLVKNSRAVKILRMMKVLRVARLRNLPTLHAVDVDSSTSKGSLKARRLLKPVIVILLASHLFACGWHCLTPTLEEEADYGRIHSGELFPNWMLSYIGEEYGSMPIADRCVRLAAAALSCARPSQCLQALAILRCACTRGNHRNQPLPPPPSSPRTVTR